MIIKKSLKILAAAFGSFLGMGAIAGCDETANNETELDGVYCNGKFYENANDPAYLACRGLNCCGQRYESATDPDYLACMQEANKNGCESPLLYGVPFAYCCGNTYNTFEDPAYLACMKNAADNGCPSIALYGVPDPQKYECCDSVYDSANDPGYLACMKHAAENGCVVAEYGMPSVVDCCGTEYASDQDPDYLACMEDAAQNGCHSNALYGMPSTLPCCGREFDPSTNTYAACKLLEDAKLCGIYVTSCEEYNCDGCCSSDGYTCCGHTYYCTCDDVIQLGACKLKAEADQCDAVPPPKRND